MYSDFLYSASSDNTKAAGGKRPNQTYKSLMVFYILLKMTDADHPMETSRIKDILSSFGIQAENLSIQRDIKNLRYLLDGEEYDEEQLQDILFTKPSVGRKYKLGSAEVKILDFGNIGNESIVLLVKYRKTSFLFTGDTEHEMEKRICDRYSDHLPVTLLKVGHHGASSSTAIRFLTMLTDPKRKMKQYAVISVGEDNGFGHPSQSVIDRIDQAGFEIYRTDRDGDINVQSDGRNLQIITGRQ